ncbi:CPBP family intramembrane glutamic endopeptidase [Myceligenerans crystallogenes]|uniref:CPBP family intramembrane glutamic endopeptidase n=1 Tax=Myceligenerans crystallogenes TaxID=316335 RepID=UPI0031DF8F35
MNPHQFQQREFQQRPTAAPRTASRFFGLYVLIVMAAVVAATAPVLFGADATYLGVVTPLFMWVPAATVLLLHLVLRPRGPDGERLPLFRTAALPLRPVRPVVFGALVITAGLCLLPVVTILAGGAIGVIDVGATPEATALIPLIVPTVIVLMVSTLGEESAWRGYLTTLLGPRGFWGTTLLIGGLWALWHLPLTGAYWIAGDMAGREVLTTTVNLLLAAVALSALRFMTGSVWPAVLGHALHNALLQFAYSNFMTPTRELSDAAYWTFTAVAWTMWIVLDAVLVLLAHRRPNSRV